MGKNVRNKTKMPDSSVAGQVRQYLDGHPVIADALRMRIGNYSAIARRIAQELGIPATDAILAACRRYPRGEEAFQEAGVRRVLRKSRIESRTKVAAVTVAQGGEVLQRLGDVVEDLLDKNSLCRVIQVSRGTVVIVDEDSVAQVTRALRESQLLSVRKNLIEVAVTSPESIEETPGLLRHLTGVLATRGINIVEALSCYTDTIFLLDDEDLASATTALKMALQ
jgi:aspartokinase